ncbi:MAG: hypothetical protein Q7T55_22735 [Solirubrobacteraceae bacterium]|nr:hypothetical protein [Solirubrobacteraceae bacterium]
MPLLSVSTPRAASGPPSRVRAGRAFVAVACAVLVMPSLADAATSMTPVAPTPTVAPTPLPVAPPFRAMLSLSAAGGTTAVLREIADDQLELLVGFGADLRSAVGVAPLRGSRVDFPRIHVGTDEAGGAVVVYPRCTSPLPRPEGRRVCDLHVYDVATGKDRLVPGVRRPQRSEQEGVMDRGSLLYAATGPSAGRTGLWYRPAGGAERRIARNPGRQLALSGTRVAQVITDGSKDAGEEPCDNSTIVVRSTLRPGAGEVLGRECLYPSWTDTPSDAWASPSFVGNRLVWTRDAGSGPSLLRYDVRTRKLEEARAGRVYGFAPTAADAGLALVLTADMTGSDDEPAANELRTVGAIRWTVRKKTLIKESHYVAPNPLA